MRVHWWLADENAQWQIIVLRWVGQLLRRVGPFGLLPSPSYGDSEA